MADRSQTSQGSSAAERRGLDLSSAPDDVQAILNRIMHLEDENRRLEAELRRAREREASVPLPSQSSTIAKGTCPSGKRVYYKKHLAERAVVEAARRRELGPLRYYKCPDCDWWHLSSVQFSEGDRVVHGRTAEHGSFIEYLPVGQVRVLWDGRGEIARPCPGIGYLRDLRVETP